MPTANIVLQQQNDGNQVSQSRDDLILNSTVTLLNQSNSGVTSWIWQLIDKPQGSNAVISSSTVPSPTFLPDVAGTYLIKLTINGGIATDQKGGAVKTANLHYRIPAAAEEGEFDSVRGWAKAVNDSLQKLDDGYGNVNSIVVPSSRQITAGYGLIGGGDLTADRSFALHTFGSAGTYNTVFVDAYGRIISGSLADYALNSLVIHTTGDESITGNKSFSSLFIDNTQIITTGATPGQILAYNGTAFVPTPVSSNITGSGTANQITFWNGSSSITSNSHLTYDNTFFGVGESGHPITSVFWGDVTILTNLDTFGPSTLNIGSVHATGGTIGNGGTTGSLNWGINGVILYSQNGTNSVNVSDAYGVRIDGYRIDPTTATATGNTFVFDGTNFSAKRLVGGSFRIDSSGIINIDSTLGDVCFLSSTGNITSITISAGTLGQIFTLNMFQGDVSFTWPTIIANARIAGGSFTKTQAQQSVDTITFRWNDIKTRWDEIGRATNLS